MAAFWAVFTFGGSGPALTAHGSLDLKQEIQIQMHCVLFWGNLLNASFYLPTFYPITTKLETEFFCLLPF
jgi:hypothetical protein